MKRATLWIEFLFLFIVMPLLFTFVFSSRGLFGVLWVMAIYAWWILRTRHGFTLRGMWNGAAVTWANIKPILTRFMLSAALLTFGVWLFEPERLFGFPQERTALWAMVMLFYPILSVIPQEIVFRSFFFARYASSQRKLGFITDQRWIPAFAGMTGRETNVMIFLNALLFGFAHIILQNWVAVGLCVIGGYFFAQTYQRTRSLALVWIEHTLYGCFIFTVGLGYYFYHGTVQAVGG